LKSKNVDINDKKLRLGTGKVGIFKYIKNFETLNQKQILDMIASHDDVYKIKINYGNGNYIENIYDYTRETPTIEIEQLK
jgi:hypothetical protein